MICGQISADVCDLDVMHAMYPWLPNSDAIRPNETDLLRKHALVKQIEAEWLDQYHYILHTVFHQPCDNLDTKKFVPCLTNLRDTWFAESPFRYALPDTTNHYILWFSKINHQSGCESADPNAINEIIHDELSKITDDFDFAWYINPKPSVLDFFHVQVFWIKT
jgi:hypothetical protein